MKILIASATWMEIKLLADELNSNDENDNFIRSVSYNGNDIDILITGIGTVFTTYRLTRILNQNRYDMILNTGIAGSFNKALKIGEVVNVVSDEFADLGVERREEFLTLFESGFVKPDEYPFKNGILNATYDGLFLEKFRQVHGITSNVSHGNLSSIIKMREKYKGDIETMEGAAVFYVGANMGIPCCQLRSISNYVEPHDSTNWNIPLSIENLKSSLIDVFKTLE